MSQGERAYRTPQPRSLCRQLLLLGTVEVALVVLGGGLDGTLRWSTTFSVAITCSAVVLLTALMLSGGPWPRYPVLIVLAFHGVAIAFVVSVGYGGGGAPWAVAAAIAGSSYATALALWFRARRRETDAGMPPGVGLTGAAVVRPQFDPRRVPLASEARGNSPAAPVVLLHGLGATMAFWRPVTRRLETLDVPTLTPDLLGFGASIRLGTTFGIVDQAAAVIRLIASHDRGPVLIAAHSYGAAVAVQVAIDRPDLVAGLVLIEPAAFADAAEARRRLGERSWLSRTTVDGSRAADWACGVMCLFRIPLIAAAPHLAHHFSRFVPADVARGAVTYVWPAYREALASLLHANPLTGWLARPLVPTIVVVGASDRTVPPDSIRALVGEKVRFEEVAGTHALPLEHPDVIASLVAEAHAEMLREKE